MASKIRVKHKATKSALSDTNIIDAFQDMIGGGPPSAKGLLLMVPKYETIRETARRYIATVTTLSKSGKLRELIESEMDKLVPYLDTLNSQFETSFQAPDMKQYLKNQGPGIESLIIDYSDAPAEVIAQFGEEYRKSKECDLVRGILVTCSNLTKYKHFIGNKDKLSNVFLKTPGSSLRPIDGCNFNFKQAFNLVGESERLYLLLVLNKLYTIAHELYEAVTSPDIDVGEFVSILVDNIDSLKKSIPRCNEAFDRIRESIGLLKNNFGNYYREFAASGNPAIIMENFVLDVSKTAKNDLKIMNQFREIISHYKKIAGQNSSNPKIQSLMKHIDANFKLLEKKTKQADDAADRGVVPDETDDEEDDESDADETEEVETGDSPDASDARQRFSSLAESKTIDSEVYQP